MTNSMAQFAPILSGLTGSDWNWMQKNMCGNRDQLFTFTPLATGDGETIHIKVTELAAAIYALAVDVECRMISVSDDLYQQIIKGQGIERGHLDRIPLDEAVYKPAVIIEFPSGEHVITDGNHKLVKSYEL